MMASRFTKAFQLIALVLAFSVAQVYVMAGPVRSITDPRTPDTSSASQPKAETALTVTASSESQPAPEAAAEKIALRIGSKTTLNRLFSKSDLEARLATGNTFLKANTSAVATFKAAYNPTSAAQTSSTSTSDDSDHTGRRGTWIAVGVIAAVLTIAVIGLRHDRSHPSQEQ